MPTRQDPPVDAGAVVVRGNAVQTVVVIWIVGASVIFLRLVCGVLVFRRRILLTGTAATEQLLNRCDRLRAELRVRQPVSLMITEAMASQTTFGGLLPTIILPT